MHLPLAVIPPTQAILVSPTMLINRRPFIHDHAITYAIWHASCQNHSSASGAHFVTNRSMDKLWKQPTPILPRQCCLLRDSGITL